ncbi:MAG: IS4 family transposase [Pirellulales bacterium]
MRASIAKIVEQFKQGWSQELTDEAIDRAVRETGHQWRDRILDPLTTVRLFFLQILCGNVACNALPHLARMRFTGSAYCEARGRFPLQALEILLTRATAKMAERVRDTGLWLGHRLFIVDGSSFSMSDTKELREHFGQSGAQTQGCGFPIARWVALVHYGSGLFQKVLTAPLRIHDMSRAAQLHPELKAGDVLSGDRAFCSFPHLALLISAGIHAIVRAHQKLIVDFTAGRAHFISNGAKRKGKKSNPQALPHSRWIAKLGPMDQIVEWFRPAQRPNWMSSETFAHLPASIRVRELRYKIGRPGYRVREITLVTTLLDASVYSSADLAAAYGLRWTIETNFGHLKTTMKMDVLHCKTVRGVLKELTMFLLVYNLVRMTMLEAARRQDVAVERISFVDALRWLATAEPGDELPNLVINPLRRGRAEPRVRKRRPKGYKNMTQPRDALRNALLQQEVAA